jgi:hypothetical protein
MQLVTDMIKRMLLCIVGSADEAPPGFEWVGRGRKTYLYDIVANKVYYPILYYTVVMNSTAAIATVC